ncbi:MBL fold metallo-hydrolase [Clostridium sp. Marseille-P299]|uniref:MBL fold metallo-hydrolase n=1 Tax=Clostridium sp. Marseille-P299 TaxID=1805477 RepID=UPI00083301E7|nr:MBL fold metallo-hydrolase [Clostridium sp. Marseille-P299]
MKLKALSHYDGDKDTRYGDCILLYDNVSLIVYDCGHTRHAQEVEKFLEANSLISQVHIVVSHNDSDHTNGVIELLEYLYDEQYTVTVYSSLYLKSARKVLDVLDDERRTLPATKKHILEKFDNIKEIVEKAQEYGFTVKDAAVNTKVATGTIAGPTEDEFVEVVAQAIEDDSVTKIEGETVMNAASVQLKCELDGTQTILLCGDASPSYLHNLDSYEIIQLPHHGKLDDAQRIFEELKDSYSKTYLVSDNTGSGATSGGSDNLVQYMQEEYYTPALNTKKGVVDIPKKGFSNISVSKPQGVKLGEMDYKYW